MSDEPEQTNEYAGLLESLFDAIRPGQAPSGQLSTVDFLNRQFDQFGGYMGAEARAAYLRGELPPGRTQPLP